MNLSYIIIKNYKCLFLELGLNYLNSQMSPLYFLLSNNKFWLFQSLKNNILCLIIFF